MHNQTVFNSSRLTRKYTFAILDDLVQYIALVWLREFLVVDGLKMLQFASGYMLAILPCLAYREDHKRGMLLVAVALLTLLF